MMQLSGASDGEEQKPIKQSFCGSLRRDAHWKCLILTVLICGCLVAIAWCRMAIISTIVINYSNYGTRLSDATVTKSSPCEDGYIYIPVAFVIMLYLVYLVECWHSHTRIELQHKVDVHTVYDKIAQMRENIPIVWWKALCYHYVRKTRQVTRYRNGDAFMTTQVYYERINSHTASSAFNFTQCGVKDMSAALHGLEEYPATKIRFSKGFSFANRESEMEFDEQRHRFFTENERRDDYMETREGMDLLNVSFREYMIAFADPDNLPWYVSHIIFWIASFLLMSWPLRVIIEFKTAYVHYHVHKLFGTNYDDEVEPYSRNISRVNTMGSSDFELTIRNNYAIVPSYSEALLMESGRTYGIPDANGNVTSPTYGATRSVTLSSLSSVAKKGVITRFSSGSLHPTIPRCHSYSVINGSLVIQNTSAQDMQNDIYANRPRRKTRRMFTIGNREGYSTENVLTDSPQSPQEFLVSVNPRTSNARLVRIRSFNRKDNTTGNASNETETSSVGASNSSSSCHANNISEMSSLSHNMSEARSSPNLLHNPSNSTTHEQPPSYEDALTMQRPVGCDSRSPSPYSVRFVRNERDHLTTNSSQPRGYHAIRETSL